MFDEKTIAAIDSGAHLDKAPAPRSLFHFLAWKGGLRPDPELRAILDKRNPFVPGCGSLIRKTGLTLDAAREACVEAGFMRDAGDVYDTLSQSTINDLLELIAAEARGCKQYREQDAGAVWDQSAMPVKHKPKATKQTEMTGAEFKSAVDTIGLSVYAAAPFLGISLRQAQRIAAGEYPAPLAIVRLLRLMIAKKITAEKLRD